LFLEHCRVVGFSPNTVRLYAYGVGLWLRYLDAVGHAWDEPTVSMVTGYLGWLRAGCGTADEGALSSATINARVAAVGAFYRYHQAASAVPFPGLVRRARSRYRPMLSHLADRRSPRPALPRVESVRASQPPTLTPAQIELILDSCAERDEATGVWVGSLRERLLFELLAETGLRLGEALGLRHQDWLAGRGETPSINIVARINPHRVRVKGGRDRRVFISDRLERLYGEYTWLVSDRAWSFGRELADDWYVFVNLGREPRFAPIRPENVYATVGRIKRRLGDRVPVDWTPHWFRHTHATALLLAGVPEHVVMRRLGHADIQTTMNLYGWVTAEAELRTVAEWQRHVEGWRVEAGDHR